jgi:DNA modification methylase
MNVKCSYDEVVAPHKLIPNPKNPNKHPPEQIDRLAKLIDFQGQRHPVIVSKRSGFVVVGHGRLEAIKKLNWDGVAVNYQDFENEAQEFAFVTSDNAIAEWAELDLALINQEMLDLGPDFDLELLGLKDFVVEPIEKFEPQSDEDDVPEVVHPITRKGDLWLLGKHRLLCGDSTMIDDVERLMNAEKAHMVFTSPPYNGNTHLADGDVFANKAKKLYGDGHSDDLKSDDYVQFTSSVLENCFIFTDGFIFWNVNYNANSRSEFIKQIVPRLDYLIETVCWKKHHAVPFKGSLMRQWEPVFIFSTNKKQLGNDVATVNHWEIGNRNVQEKSHKACFPVELPEKGILLASSDGNLILEPFTGSGTTLIACEKTNRKCYGMELDEKYCDVIIKRWEQYTGKKATLESTGQTYEELKTERDA